MTIRRALRVLDHVPFWLVALAGMLVWLVGCGSVQSWSVLEMLPHVAGSAPGVLAALVIAGRAHARVKEADAARIEADAKRIVAETDALNAKTIRESELQKVVVDALQGARADLGVALNAYNAATSREVACERRCDALNDELVELREILVSGGFSLPARG